MDPPLAPKYTCVCCRVRFESPDMQRDHFKMDWHAYNLKRKVCKLDPIDFNTFSQLQEVNKNEKKVIVIPEVDSDVDTDDSSDWDDIEEVSDNEQEITELLKTAMPPSVCFFCNKASLDMRANLTHMDRFHGFFVPEEQYVTNLDGFVDYVRFKVGAAATCLWCDKKFFDVGDAQRHMRSKDHCKIRYDQEKAINEFKEFYDYTNQERHEMKPLNQLVIVKKRSRPENHDRALVKPANTTKDVSCRQSIMFNGGSRDVEKTRHFIKRARIALKTAYNNNNTMRGRLRHQNPM